MESGHPILRRCPVEREWLLGARRRSSLDADRLDSKTSRRTAAKTPTGSKAEARPSRNSRATAPRAESAVGRCRDTLAPQITTVVNYASKGCAAMIDPAL